ncbi:MAG TPA: PDZ domain-containing protein [Verrucomicrobiota bacterium]|nr:PDZ domain-containing protein [Verrucomicrobiota bacterium]
MKTEHTKSQIMGVMLGVALAAGFASSAWGSPDKVAYLGVIVSTADETLRNQVKLPRGVGLSVIEVVADSPAEKCGIKVHDVLEKLDDQLLCNGEQLTALVRSREPGSKVMIALIRQGKRETVEVTLGETESEPPKPAPFEDFGERFRDLGRAFKELPELKRFRDWVGPFGEWGPARPSPFLGVQLGPVDPALAAQLGLEEGTGALVNAVVDESPAAKAGIKRHDVIVKIEGDTVRGPGDVVKRISERKNGDKIKLELFRGGKKVEAEAVLTDKASPSPEPRRLRDALKSIKELEYRYVPRLHVFSTRPEENQADEIVIQLEEDEDGNGKTVRSRSEVRSRGVPRPGLRNSIVRKGGDVPKPPMPGQKTRVIVVRTEKDVTTVREEDGERFVTVKDLNDKVIFDGKVNSEADKEKLPAEVRERLDRIDRDIREREKDGLFENEVRELRVPLPPTPPGVI